MRLLQIVEAYSRPDAIKNAVINRRRIKFYYAGPRKGKDSVKAGGRYEVEPVAMGLTKKGNMAIRGWVNNTGSVTKTGFEKGQWRTFLLARMHQLDVTDDIFDEKRPGYKEGDDSSFKVTYATSDWEKKPYRRKFEKELSRRERAAREKELALQKQKDTEIEKDVETDLDLPQPKPETTPPVEPPKAEPEEPQVQPEPTPTPELKREPEPAGEPELDPEAQPHLGPEEDENLQLQESINKIKHLMFF